MSLLREALGRDTGLITAPYKPCFSLETLSHW